MFLEGIVIEEILSMGFVQVLKTISSLLSPYNETGSFVFLLFLMKTFKESPLFSTFLILKSIVLRVSAKSSKNQLTGRSVCSDINASKSDDLIGFSIFSE